MATTMTSKEAASLHNLSDLFQSAGGVELPPSDEQITTLLHQRFRTDNPYTRIASSTLLVVNPLKTLANLNDASAGDYHATEYTDTSGDELPGGPMQPHLYELAARVYLLMRRRKESQAVVFR
jgi:chitin synthase